MTTATPTFDDPTSIPSRRRATRGWRALAAGLLAIAAITGAVLAFDGSDAGRPVAPVPGHVGESDIEIRTAPAGLVSADAAERRALAAADRCVGMSADAAERCVARG